MIFGVFSIYDSAVSTWRPPIYARSKGEILRSFTDAANNPQTDFAKHPGDYTLFDIGTWDDDKCLFALHKTPISLGKAVEFIKAS